MSKKKRENLNAMCAYSLLQYIQKFQIKDFYTSGMILFSDNHPLFQIIVTKEILFCLTMVIIKNVTNTSKFCLRYVLAWGRIIVRDGETLKIYEILETWDRKNDLPSNRLIFFLPLRVSLEILSLQGIFGDL